MRKFTIIQSDKNGAETQTIEADHFKEEENGSIIFYVKNSVKDSYSLHAANNNIQVGLFFNVEEISSEEIEDSQYGANVNG